MSKIVTNEFETVDGSVNIPVKDLVFVQRGPTYDNVKSIAVISSADFKALASPDPEILYFLKA